MVHYVLQQRQKTDLVQQIRTFSATAPSKSPYQRSLSVLSREAQRWSNNNGDI